MELCENLYREWKIRGKLSRMARMLAVVILLELLVGSVCIMEPVYSEGGRSAGVETDIEKAVAAVTAPAVISEALPVPGTQKIAGANMPDTQAVPKRDGEVVPEHGVEVFAGIPDAGGMAENVQDMVSLPSSERVPQIPDETVPQMPEAVPSVPDEPAGSVPSDTPEEENTVPPAAVGGFYVDESGMICGIADPSVVEDGCLVLPSEGCRGIRRGAFAGAPAGICEVFIPANITLIEEGAMSDLSDAEWFEAEPGSYYTEDGVLFSEEGTCLLAFPSARTGFYKVPSGVSRFAHDAFAGARIETVDVTKCTLTDMGNLPENVAVLDTPGRIVVY